MPLWFHTPILTILIILSIIFMYFYYCLANKWGSDQVCRDTVFYGNVWDLILSNGVYFINLGEALSRKDFYISEDHYFQIYAPESVCSIMNGYTLQLVHWMVYQYCTTYKSIIQLFLPNISLYLKQEQKKKTMTAKSRNALARPNAVTTTSLMTPFCTWECTHHTSTDQTLVVFPDMLSLQMRYNNQNYLLWARDNDTKTAAYYYDLQHGYKNILITTSANICMDYKKLSQIICYFPDTRYYKYQQDPRICIPDVLEKMAKLHGAEYTVIGSGFIPTIVM